MLLLIEYGKAPSPPCHGYDMFQRNTGNRVRNRVRMIKIGKYYLEIIILFFKYNYGISWHFHCCGLLPLHNCLSVFLNINGNSTKLMCTVLLNYKSNAIKYIY